MTQADGGGTARVLWIAAAVAGILTLLYYRGFILDGSSMLYGDDMINEGDHNAGVLTDWSLAQGTHARVHQYLS